MFINDTIYDIDSSHNKSQKNYLPNSGNNFSYLILDSVCLPSNNWCVTIDMEHVMTLNNYWEGHPCEFYHHFQLVCQAQYQDLLSRLMLIMSKWQSICNPTYTISSLNGLNSQQGYYHHGTFLSCARPIWVWKVFCF